MYLSRFISPKPKRIYMDMAAATPVRKSVFEAMKPYFSDEFANPSAIHKEGQHARRAIEEARTLVGKTLEVKPECVFFTGSGTESNNLAIIGRIEQLVSKGATYSDLEILTTELEHPSVREAMTVLRQKGVGIKMLAVSEEGVISIESLHALLSPKTALVSFSYVNSEIGTIQPVGKLVRAVREYEQLSGKRIPVHLDAAQAPLWLSCQFDRLGADLLALDAGKCFGPKGVGLLIKKRDIELAPVQFGGGQEGGLRPATENVAGIVGAAKALEFAQGNYEVREAEVSEVRDYFFGQVAEQLPQAIVNGAMGDGRVANNVNISIPEIDSEFAVVVLDSKGVAASTKSACSGAGGGESRVVKTISDDAARAKSTLRFTFGSEVTKTDVDRVITILKEHSEKNL